MTSTSIRKDAEDVLHFRPPHVTYTASIVPPEQLHHTINITKRGRSTKYLAAIKSAQGHTFCRAKLPTYNKALLWCGEAIEHVVSEQLKKILGK